MYHRFNYVDLKGTYNGFLIPNLPRAAPQACGLSPGFNGLRWIILVFFSDMNNTLISSLIGYFPYLFAVVCFLPTWLSYSMCVLCATLGDIQLVLASRWGTSKSLDHWLLHLILGKSKCEKSLLKQYLHHQVGPRMFMKAVCHITCNLQSMKCCISYFSMLPGGKKCQNYLALHLFRNPSTWQIRASKPYMSLCPRSPGEMRNLCVLYRHSL